MILVLDNAESILDPQGMGARKIYAVVEELSQFKTICLCVTSRISTVPRHCKHLVIPTLSTDSARDIFYSIHDNGSRSDTINNLLERLDFHPLSITLLATTASHNMWDHDRLAREWEGHRTQAIRTDYNESLAATIELSLASPTFRGLGPEARDVLGVAAFFPQGVNEKNLNWLFSTIPDRVNIFDKFCMLSLTHRTNGFIMMLAPLRDYLCPKDPTSSPLLHKIKECYFRRLSVNPNPNKPGFTETRWIILEDANVEHLLDVFTTVDPNSNDVWGHCGYFMAHLYWQKVRLVVLGPKIERLPDNHPSKPWCLLKLSRLIYLVGNYEESKRLFAHTLKLWRERRGDLRVARTLGHLSNVNRAVGLYEEGVQQVKEALKIFEQYNDIPRQAKAFYRLARLLCDGGQFDAAEGIAFQAIDLLSETYDRFRVCQCHRILGDVYRSKAQPEKAVNHFETALQIASFFDWQDELFWVHYGLAQLFAEQDGFDNAHTHIERAKSHAVNDPYCLGRGMGLQARFWYREHKFDDARSEALRAADIYEKLGAAKDLEDCRSILWHINEAISEPVASCEDLDSELLDMVMPYNC